MGPPEDLGIKNTEIQKSRNAGIQKQFVLLVEGGHRVVGVAAGDPPYRPGGVLAIRLTIRCNFGSITHLLKSSYYTL